jgi:hypothetical protein
VDILIRTQQSLAFNYIYVVKVKHDESTMVLDRVIGSLVEYTAPESNGERHLVLSLLGLPEGEYLVLAAP